MSAFKSAREAKEFLASRIVDEAQQENVVLSETERKMLYFSETEWTLPDIAAVSDDFDAAYNQRDYEKKIARLIRNAGKRARQRYANRVRHPVAGDSSPPKGGSLPCRDDQASWTSTSW
jgi:hypothetical protein